MDIITALTNYIETEYRDIRINETDASTNMLCALVSLVSISHKDKDRFLLILSMFMQNMTEIDRTNFLSKHQLPGEIYQKLTDFTLEWPAYLPVPDVEIGMDESAILSLRKLTYVEKINKIRDVKIDGGFTWNGHVFQSRASDRENIIGSAVAAQLAIGQGATPGDYRWANPDSDFQWITADNSLVTLDAFDVLSMYAAGIAFKTNLTFFARAMKDEIIALDTLIELEAFDIEAGWPY